MTAVVVAPAPFKGALAAAAAARAIGAGVRLALPDCEIRSAPVADGGEGTMDALTAALGGRRRPVSARIPSAGPSTRPSASCPGRRPSSSWPRRRATSGCARTSATPRPPARGAPGS